MMEIAGINIIQVVEVIITLAATYIIAKIVSRTLEKIFEKTPFPEQIEKAIVKISKYVVYIVGFFVIVSFLGFDLSSVIVGLGAFQHSHKLRYKHHNPEPRFRNISSSRQSLQGWRSNESIKF